MIEYRENGNLAVFDGYYFRRDKKTGYYLSSQKIDGKRRRLHIYVWEKTNGTIPNGFHVHHIDCNKTNNELENLKLLSAKEHSSLHGTELITEEQKRKRKENILINATPVAKEWHKSKSGSDWHKHHYEDMKEKLYEKKEFSCEYCGKPFIAVCNGHNKFCSNNCKSAYRRKSGIDNITKVCTLCGGEYIANKYSKTKYCENCKGKKSGS